MRLLNSCPMTANWVRQGWKGIILLVSNFLDQGKPCGEDMMGKIECYLKILDFEVDTMTSLVVGLCLS
jgi:hypothetical protein